MSTQNTSDRRGFLKGLNLFRVAIILFTLCLLQVPNILVMSLPFFDPNKHANLFIASTVFLLTSTILLLNGLMVCHPLTGLWLRRLSIALFTGVVGSLVIVFSETMRGAVAETIATLHLMLMTSEVRLPKHLLEVAYASALPSALSLLLTGVFFVYLARLRSVVSGQDTNGGITKREVIFAVFLSLYSVFYFFILTNAFALVVAAVLFQVVMLNWVSNLIRRLEVELGDAAGQIIL